MTQQRADLIGQIDEATERLIAAVQGLSDEDARAASALPEWTRGHVLTHIARSGDALSNLLTWARTEVEIPDYIDAESRDADIQSGSQRPVAELVTDVSESAERFKAVVKAMSDKAWKAKVTSLNGDEFPAEHVLTWRLLELHLHHTDLDVGYKPSDWPKGFSDMKLDEGQQALRQERRDRK